jgi:hypothetical protein
MQTRSTERTGAGGLLRGGAPKAEIRNAAATTSRCVGSEQSGQPEWRPARDYFLILSNLVGVMIGLGVPSKRLKCWALPRSPITALTASPRVHI